MVESDDRDIYANKVIWKTSNKGGQTLMKSAYNTNVIIEWENDRNYLACLKDEKTILID